MLGLQPPPPEPEWHQSQTRSVLLAEQEAAQQEQARLAHQQAQAYQAQLAHQRAQHDAWMQYQQYSAQYVTSYAQANPTGRPTLRTWLLAGLVTVGSLLMALLFAAYYGLGFGIVLTLVSLCAALIPLALVTPIFLWLDRLDAEPWRYLITAFLYGSLVSTAMAIFGNAIGAFLWSGVASGQELDTLVAVTVAPVVEETTKGIFLLAVWALFHRRFNGITDGIVYAGIVAAGFAFTENIQYFAQAFLEGGGWGFGFTFALRGLVTPFLHPMFTTMTGIGIGLAVVSRSIPVKLIAPFLGWCMAVLLHGLWNLTASFGLIGLVVGLLGGFVAFVGFIAFVIWTRKREARVIGTHLQPYAETGWISPQEVGMLASMRGRREARAWAKHYRGPGGLKSMRSFQDSASELALLRHRMLSHTADHRALHRERVLLDSMTARRREFAGVG